MKTQGGVKFIIMIVIMAGLVIGYYYHLSNRNVPTQEESVSEDGRLTKTQEVLVRNLETNYPQTPREVVKYFSEITQCFYNEEHSDAEIEALGRKAREIYDQELLDNQSELDYLNSLKNDINEYRANNRTIVSYTPSSSVDVEDFYKDGYDCARLYCLYGIKQGELLYNTNMVFILRKDENSHYKIMGWKILKDQQAITYN